MSSTDNILLYQAPDGQTQLEVQLDHETLWLNQAQLAQLFGRERSVIGKHLRNIFQTGELVEESNVQKMPIAFSDKPVRFYNLEVIISVGYRVNSIKGTHFRQWATGILRQYLVQGYALNEKRLRESARQLADLKRLVQLQGEVAINQELTSDQSDALLRVLGDYARALDVLDQYDHQRLQVRGTATEEPFELTYEAGLKAVDSLRTQFGGSSLFGREKDASFQSSVRSHFTRALMAKTCTRAWRKKPQTCYILW
ncbi:virulence RhuM family protein [Hymenobacter glacialis]|uniref:virulence RhuM family protein n=1 Tax=Hymenobacter glacialis TaxID=1908236 RepID=UPI000A79E9C3|nr:RhuM family protein [Hymenobacter glacialis]